MNHINHVDLLRKGIKKQGGLWADLGAGSGAFTLALAELIDPSGQIYAVDKDRGALQRLQKAMRHQFPAVSLETRAANFTHQFFLPLPTTSPVALKHWLVFTVHSPPIPNHNFIVNKAKLSRSNF